MRTATNQHSTTMKMNVKPTDKSLRLWEEIVGQLINVVAQNDYTILTILVGETPFKIRTISVEDNLKNRIGERIGILRTDDQEQPFLIRKNK